MNDSYAPHESAAGIAMERGLIDGYVVAGASFGILLTLVIQMFHSISCVQIQLRHISWPRIAFVFVMFALASVGYGTLIKFNEMTFIDYEPYPGGPLAFTNDFAGDPMNMTSVVAYCLLHWFCNIFMLDHLYRLWKNLAVLIAPGVLFLASIGLSVVDVVHLTHPNAVHYHSTIAYWAVALVLSLYWTAAIAYRIHSSSKSDRRLPLHVLDICIQSGILYTGPAVVFVIGLALNSPVLYSRESVQLLQAVVPISILLWRAPSAPLLNLEEQTAQSAISALRNKGAQKSEFDLWAEENAKSTSRVNSLIPPSSPRPTSTHATSIFTPTTPQRSAFDTAPQSGVESAG